MMNLHTYPLALKKYEGNLLVNMPAKITAQAEQTPAPRPHSGKAPVAICPVCGSKALARTSVEITPTFRELYYRCSNIMCGMTYVASLSFERTLSPSGLGDKFREPVNDRATPPGHEYGQINMANTVPRTMTG